jgi:hypothetical protein
MTRPRALNRARQTTAGVLAAATLATGGVAFALANAATTASTSTSTSSDSSSSTGFGSTSTATSSGDSAQTTTRGS